MRGFTLIELILVISLTGILAIVALPYLDDALGGRAGLETALARVRNDIVFARQRAMLTGVNHGVDFAPGLPYEVYSGSVGTPIIDPLTQQPMRIDIEAENNVTVTGPYQVEFDSWGRPVVGGGGAVFFSAGGATRSVQVTDNTGLVEVP